MLSSLFRQNEAGIEAPVAKELRRAIRTTGVPTFNQSVPSIAAELRRCRRYEHPLTTLVVGLDPASIRRAAFGSDRIAGLDSSLLRRFECTALLLLGAMVRDATRESDVVSYLPEHGLYAVFLPETAEAAAQRAAERLGAMFFARAAVHLRTGLAEFPRDGLVVDDLVAAARRAWRERPRTSLAASESREVPHG